MAKQAVAERQERKTALVQVSLDLIDDNPWQPRQHYPQGDIDRIAESIEQVGLLHEPLARRRGVRFQLADGHMRKRAFVKLARKAPEQYELMPLKVADLGDRDMSLIAIHENMKRKDLTPIEEAGSYQKHLQDFRDTSMNALAKEVGISQGHLSNMLRVLELPEKVLEKVSEGKINFTQARELACIKVHEKEMLDAVRSCTGQFGDNTVAGIRRSLNIAVVNSPQFKALFPLNYYEDSPQFDVKGICTRCENNLIVPMTLTETRHWCDSPECWQKHQQEVLDKMAADARAQAQREMEAQVLQQELVDRKLQAGMSQKESKVIYVDQEKMAEVEASYSAGKIMERRSSVRNPFILDGEYYIATSGVASGVDRYWDVYKIVRREEFTGETRTYATPPGRETLEYNEELRNDPMGFYNGMAVKWGKSDWVIVGPEMIIRVREPLAEQEQKCRVCGCTETNACMTGEGPCHWAEADLCSACCDAESQKEPQSPIISQEIIGEKEAPAAVPEDMLTRARDQLGTRAEVLCVDDFLGDWGQPKSGTGAAVLTQGDLGELEDPQECLERCTHGFHYGYRVMQQTNGFSARGEEKPSVHYVCSDTKCLGKKRGAFTRAKNAERNRLRKEEARLVKEAVQHTTELTWAHMKLITEALFLGETNTSGLTGPHWNLFRELWPKLDLEGGCDGYLGRNQREQLVKKMQSLSERELAGMLTEISFDMVRDHGTEGKFQFKTKRHLVNMGLIQEKPGRNVVVEARDGEKHKIALGSITGIHKLSTEKFPPREDGEELPDYVWSLCFLHPGAGSGSYTITDESAEQLQELGVKVLPKWRAPGEGG